MKMSDFVSRVNRLVFPMPKEVGRNYEAIYEDLNALLKETDLLSLDVSVMRDTWDDIGDDDWTHNQAGKQFLIINFETRDTLDGVFIATDAIMAIMRKYSQVAQS